MICTMLMLISGQQILLDPGENTAIDFSEGVVEADGVMCVVNEEERENLEQEEETQCTQQNVTQCYSSYVTKYTDSVREKCEEVFIKTCRIIMRSRAYNHTTRICKRPLLKQCNSYEPPLPTYGEYGAPPSYGYGSPTPEPKLVCRDVYETVCNTTTQAPVNGRSALPVTICDQISRRICAEDHCHIVEGEPECAERTIENTVDVPEETCNMEPVEECRNVTVSIPNLVPEEECREVPKEVCQVVFLNPRTVKTTAMVKYCMKLQGGSVNESGRTPQASISPRSQQSQRNPIRNSPSFERLTEADLLSGFRPVQVNQRELPPELQRGRGRPRGRGRTGQKGV